MISKKILTLLVLIFSLSLTSCGKKGPLTYLGERKIPKFDHVIDEE